ncbi:Hypothetical protein D9617_3g021290 [Elsinoe fawcettii]|nr:Hypothetical protein D9617_3g021290 [Elsinoe fawcettii]
MQDYTHSDFPAHSAMDIVWPKAILSETLLNTTTIIILLAAYIPFVHLLRHRRATTILQKHNITSRDQYHLLTADQAQSVLQDLVELEFPTLMGFSIVFALFKTYGIPSISSLLLKTGELSSPLRASKRIADTGVLLLEFCLNPPSSKRSKEAIGRMNFLHSGYIKAGKISNDDMLYTLSVFALEPVRWIDRFEWRALTDFELCATGTFWRSIGDRMGIDMSALNGAEEGWRDGLEWLDAVREWGERYEEKKMAPDESNRGLVLANLDVSFLNVPVRLRGWGGLVVSVVAGSRLREAMMLRTPPAWFEDLLLGVLVVRKYVLRYLFLPRFGRKTHISSHPESNGHYSSQEYVSHPWYVRPTLQRRWGLKAWFTWFIGRKLPGDDGNIYNPEGYDIRGIGPMSMQDKGSCHMVREVERFKTFDSKGCPFSGE